MRRIGEMQMRKWKMVVQCRVKWVTRGPLRRIRVDIEGWPTLGMAAMKQFLTVIGRNVYVSWAASLDGYHGHEISVVLEW